MAEVYLLRGHFESLQVQDEHGWALLNSCSLLRGSILLAVVAVDAETVTLREQIQAVPERLRFVEYSLHLSNRLVLLPAQALSVPVTLVKVNIPFACDESVA